MDIKTSDNLKLLVLLLNIYKNSIVQFIDYTQTNTLPNNITVMELVEYLKSCKENVERHLVTNLGSLMRGDKLNMNAIAILLSVEVKGDIIVTPLFSVLAQLDAIIASLNEKINKK